MLKRIFLTVGAALLLVVLGAGTATASARAGTQLPLSAARLPSLPLHVTLSIHEILGENSIDGPAFSSITDNFGGVHFKTVLGWTGTDALHHLNLLSSTDNPALGPLHFGNKLILHETSFARPAVQATGGGLGFTVVAWTGTDPAHTLNVLEVFSTSTVLRKLTLWGETSIGAPGLVAWKGGFALAWTGTDANHSLSVLPLTVALQRGVKTILPQFSSLAGPNLSVFTSGTGTQQLVLNWSTKTLHLNQAFSTDGIHFTDALGPGGTPQLSVNAPSALFAQREGGPEFWMAWTGTDPAHFLNIQWTTHWPQWPDPATTKTVLGDTALGGP